MTFRTALLTMLLTFLVTISIQNNASARYDDLAILYRMVEAEATGEGYEGKQLVTEVIMNRVHSDQFPNSIEAVVFQKNQFSPIIDGRYWEVSITRETVLAVKSIMFVGIRTASRDVLFFQNYRVDGWINDNRPLAFNHNRHNFYY